MLGLEGEAPETTDVDRLPARVAAITRNRRLNLLGNRTIRCDPDEDLVFERRGRLPGHPNGLRFTALADGEVIDERVWEAMQQSVRRGCQRDGKLPGLHVDRRAAKLHRQLVGQPAASRDPLAAMDWVNLYALAVNEENAMGGRVVTAPTNGAAGIVPAVLHYYAKFCDGDDDGVVRFLLTAGAVGLLVKANASISGAEVGCQGEVGSRFGAGRPQNVLPARKRDHKAKLCAMLVDTEIGRTMEFGGPWTQEKLRILGLYLDAYTTALKNQRFKLLYIDAFAGSGLIRTQERDAMDFLKGSTARAVEVKDRPFDELIFVEKNTARCAELETLREEHRHRNIRIENAEANDFLSNLRRDWREWRGVLFLDPFATEVRWSTIRTVAGFNALDTWILFPVSAIARMLPASREPEKVSPTWADRLTRVFGDQGWRELYRQNPQKGLFGDLGSVRDRGVDGLVNIYKGNLRGLFGDRFLSRSRCLKTSTGSPLFELMFCVGHPKGIGPARRIASHILDHM